ncbi:MAG: LON peptidase substrate-binding domain-containing protein [Woeseiaceae bacterium]|nr:LON peptidase substrate-binding domain-containing protein [Woeseiaceae bacterium]
MQVPLFPLNTVLFPGGPLPLRIFEARYVDMISHCLKENASFGVLLIREGNEAGTPATTHEVGTLARIVDWYQGSDGLLGVTAIGTHRFRLLSAERQPDGLNVGTVELLPDETPMVLPEQYAPLTEILEAILDDLGRLYEDGERHFDDAGWVANRFIEILPIALEQKQLCLESANQQQRLELVSEVLKKVRFTAQSDD